MRNRSKLILLFFCFTLLGIVIILPIYYHSIKKQFEIQAVENLESLADTSARIINFQGINELKEPDDDSKIIYKRILSDLEKIMAANEHKGMYVAFTFTLRPSDEPDHLEYIVDGDTSSNHFPIGSLTTNKVQRGLLQHLNETYTPPGFFTTQRGRLLTCYTPIYNLEGQYKATLGIAIFEGQIFSNIIVVRRAMYYSAISALVLSIILGWIVATLLTRKNRGPNGE